MCSAPLCSRGTLKPDVCMPCASGALLSSMRLPLLARLLRSTAGAHVRRLT